MNGLGALQNYVTGGQVTQAYRDILGRAPDAGGLQFYTNPNLSLADLKAQLAGSEEGRAFLAAQAPTGSAAAMQASNTVAPGTMGAGVQPTTVADLYTKYLGREADAGGLEAWTKQFGPTVDANELARFLGAVSTKAEMANLPLSQLNTNTGATGVATTGAATTGGADTSQMTVEDLYGDYLKRESDQGGLDYWTSRFGPTVDATELATFLNDPATKTEIASKNNTNVTDTNTNVDTTTNPNVTDTNTNGTVINTTTEDSTPRTDANYERLYGPAVTKLFTELLGRAPTQNDFGYYGAQLASGKTPDQLRSDISGTTEAMNWAKSQTTATPTSSMGPALNRNQINEMYLKTFGRAGDPGGLDAYQQAGVTRDQLVNSFLNSQEYRAPTGIQGIAPRREIATLQAATNFGTPAYMGGTPMTPVTAKDLGSQFVAPADYAEVFTPETTYTTQDPMLTEATASTETAEPLAGGGYIGENPAYSEYMAGQAEGGSMNMARGGRVPSQQGLHGLAQSIAAKGRGKDSMLVHMTPDEVHGLRALAHAQGHDLPINPHTGLPEAGWFSKLFRNIMKVVPFVAPFIPGIGPLAAAGLSGLAGATSGGGFNLKKGLMSGLMSYGLSGISGAGKAAESASGAATNAAGVAGADAAAKSALSQTMQGAAQTAAQTAGQATAQAAAQGAGQAATQAATQAAPGLIEGTIGNITNFGKQGLSALTGDKAAQAALAENATKGALTATAMGASGMQTAAAEEKYANQAAAIKAAEDEKNEQMRRRVEEIMRSNPLPQNFSMAGGGMASYATGGNSPKNPRMLDGPGDGMSDSIPAVIGNKQPARLADGEFVIPADIVSHLGNGSSKAGSKQLYAMMDRIRKARTGRSSQAPEVRATKLMPA